MAAAKSPAGEAYLFLGPELGQKEEALSALRKKAGGGEYMEETSFYALETPAARITETIQNACLFCAKSFYVVKNADALKAKEVKEFLAPCLAKLPEGVTVAFLTDETKVDKALDDCIPKANKKVFYEMFEADKQKWVRDFWQKAGYRIEAEAVESLLELVENNTAALKTECGRLQLFLDKKKPVTAADIERWLAHSRSESPFTLFAAIAMADLEKSVEIARSLLASKENSPRAIFAGLIWSFKRLRDYEELAAKGALNDFELRKIGLSSPAARSGCQTMYRVYAQKNGKNAKNSVTGIADACLSLTAQFDILLMSAPGMQSVLFDLYLYRVISLAV